jgi:RNA polymerase sigma-70 factor (ECF subfamily)
MMEVPPGGNIHGGAPEMVMHSATLSRPAPAVAELPPLFQDEAVELDFDAFYRQHFAFVWRSAKRLGVTDHAVDDAVQDVFLVVHRRLHEFEGRSSVRTWLFGVVLRVVRSRRRSDLRKSRVGGIGRGDDIDAVPSDDDGPHRRTERKQAVELLYRFLDGLEGAKREVFILAELEQMTAPEIAEALEINVNTVYSRLRAARSAFERAVKRRGKRASKTRRPR